MKTLNKKFISILIVFTILLAVFMPSIEVQAEGEIVIDVATVDIATPVAGEHPSFQETVGDSSKYYIDVDFTKWVQQFSPYHNVWNDDTFEAGKIYSYRVLFRPKTGYKFSDDTLFLINGKKTGQWGDDKAMAYQYFYVVDQETDVNINFRYQDENDEYVTFSQTSIKLNSTVNPPATNPTKNCFTFVKWKTANGYDVDFNDAVNSNRDFFAEFVSNENLQTHTITLNPNNGTDESDSINNIVSGSVNKLGNLESYGFTIPNDKQFYGWKVGDEIYLPGEYFEVTSNLTAVAQYIGSTPAPVTTHTVTFKDGTTTLSTDTVNSGAKVTRPATNPTKDGHAFVNWYADAGLNNLFDFENITINDDTTIYAKFNQLITSASATITAPVGGEHPSFTATSGNSDAYTTVVDTWYDLDNNGAHLTNSDTFVAGNEYQARIHFTANEGYQFGDIVTYTINGTPNYTTFDTAQQRGMNFIATAPAHTHTLTLVPAKEATCTEAGNNAYYTCSECTKVFKDALGNVETTVVAETLPIEANAHDWGAWTVTTPATEEADGEETRECNHNASHTETQPIPKLTHTHTLTLVPEKEATCMAEGNNAYYTCSGCTKVFKDALGNVETTVVAETLPIDANAHDWNDWVETTPATVDTAGEKTRTCKHNSTHIETDTIEKLALEITEGGNKTYRLDSGAKVQIKCNGTLANFDKLTSNGTDVDSSNYTKESGSTILTLKNTYLDTLSEGTYKLAFVYNDGRKAETNLTIAKANTPADTTDDDANTTTGDNTTTDTTNTTDNTSSGTTTGGETKTSNSPKTGDNIVMYIAIMLVSALGVAGTIKFIKKRA